MFKYSQKQTLRQALALFDEHCESQGYHLSQQADPSVERLLEGFCYVTQQVEDFINQRSPDVAWHLLNIIWPESLRDIPAMSIAQLTSANYPVFLPEKTLLSAVTAENECIKFSTMVDCTILPAIIESAVIDKNRLSLKIMFRSCCTAANLEKLLLYVDPQSDDCYQLSYCLRKKLIFMRLQYGETIVTLPVECFPVALAIDHDDPFLLVNRFFQCPSLCLFFEITGINRYLSQEQQNFMLHFEFQEYFKPQQQVMVLFHLNYVPVINMFSQGCEPLSISHERDCYEMYSDDQSSGESIIAVTQVSAKTLTGEAVGLYNPYRDKPLPGGVPYVLHKLKRGFNLMINVNHLQKPLVVSTQALVHQPTVCRQFYWKNAKLVTAAGQLQGRLLEKLSQPIQHELGDSVAMLTVFQRKITSQTSLIELQCLLTTLLCQSSTKHLRRIAGITQFAARSVFQLQQGVIREVVVWQVQLNPENFDTRAEYYHFAALLERLIMLYRPVNQHYRIECCDDSA